MDREAFYPCFFLSSCVCVQTVYFPLFLPAEGEFPPFCPPFSGAGARKEESAPFPPPSLLTQLLERVRCADPCKFSPSLFEDPALMIIDFPPLREVKMRIAPMLLNEKRCGSLSSPFFFSFLLSLRRPSLFSFFDFNIRADLLSFFLSAGSSEERADSLGSSSPSLEEMMKDLA